MMIRRYTTLLLTLLLFISCQKTEEQGYNPPAEASQTLLIYMPGRDLQFFYDQNITDIKAAISASTPGNGRILLCYQPNTKKQAELQELYYNPSSDEVGVEHLKSYATFNPSATADVQQLFDDVAAIAPARRYGLDISCHGKAWVPSGQSMLSMRLGAEHTTEQLLWTPLPGALPTRAFGDSGYELNISQLRDAIQGSAFKPEFMLFDACFMANIETLYELRTVTDYIVAAPCETMAAGFPYLRTLPALFTENNGYDLGEVCYEFWYFYMYDWNKLPYNAQSGCISSCVTKELSALAEVMQRVVAAGRREAEEPLQSYEGMNAHLFYDLGHYVAQTCENETLREEFKRQLERTFPIENALHTPSFYSGYNNDMNPIDYYSGVSVSEPSTRLVAQNQQTDWYKATH